MAVCKLCAAKIVWQYTKSGKWMPCNANPVEYKAGNTPDYEDLIVTKDGEVLRCTFDFQCEPDGVGYIPHWASCPYSDRFRRGQRIDEEVGE